MSTQSLDSRRALRPEESAGQWNLFTGELEPIAANDGKAPETRRLFDADSGVALPREQERAKILPFGKSHGGNVGPERCTF
jgi:hypothetical protein